MKVAEFQGTLHSGRQNTETGDAEEMLNCVT